MGLDQLSDTIYCVGEAGQSHALSFEDDNGTDSRSGQRVIHGLGVICAKSDWENGDARLTE